MCTYYRYDSFSINKLAISSIFHQDKVCIGLLKRDLNGQNYFLVVAVDSLKLKKLDIEEGMVRLNFHLTSLGKDVVC